MVVYSKMSAGFDWSSFVEAPGFLESWDEAGCTDIDLRTLQLDLLADPTGWPVVPGSGGWRKARFAPRSSGKGKSGGVRVYYADLSEFGQILLGTAFSKVYVADLSAKDKKAFGVFLAEYRQFLQGDE